MRLMLKKFLENYKKYRIGFVSGKVDDSMPRKSLVSCGRGKLYLLYPDVCRILFSGDLEERGWRMLLGKGQTTRLSLNPFLVHT